MITPSIMYKHLKKWVVDPKSPRGWLNHITFSEHEVIASDTQKLLVIKNYSSTNTNPHFELPNGTPLADEMEITPDKYESASQYISEELIPKAYKIIPKEYSYSTEIKPIWFPQMRTSFDFIKKATKKDYVGYPNVCMLNCYNGKLFALSAGERFGVKFLLADRVCSTNSPWYCYFNAANLVDAMDFVVDTKPSSMTFSVKLKRIEDTPETIKWAECNRWTGMWKIETDELIAVGTSVRTSYDPSHDPLIKFCLDESTRPTREAFIDL